MEVTFKVKETGRIVTKHFDSRYLGEQFVRKVRYSKKLTLVGFRNL